MITEIKSSTDFTLAGLEAAIRDNRVLTPVHQRETEPDPVYSTPNRPYYKYVTDENGKYVVIGYEPVGGNHVDWAYGDLYIDGFGTFENVKYWDEGDGRECGVVLKHLESGRYFAKLGTYSSWDSSYWDGDLVELEPVQVTVTKFKNKANGRIWSSPEL